MSEVPLHSLSDSNTGVRIQRTKKLSQTPSPNPLNPGTKCKAVNSTRHEKGGGLSRASLTNLHIRTHARVITLLPPPTLQARFLIFMYQETPWKRSPGFLNSSRNARRRHALFFRCIKKLNLLKRLFFSANHFIPVVPRRSTLIDKRFLF